MWIVICCFENRVDSFAFIQDKFQGDMLELLADGLSRVEGKKQKIPAGENKTFE